MNRKSLFDIFMDDITNCCLASYSKEIKSSYVLSLFMAITAYFLLNEEALPFSLMSSV